jgi:hypothetical protein
MVMPMPVATREAPPRSMSARITIMAVRTDDRPSM